MVTPQNVTGIYPAKEGLKLFHLRDTGVKFVAVTGIYPAKEGLKRIMTNSQIISNSGYRHLSSKRRIETRIASLGATNSKELPAFIQQKKDWNSGAITTLPISEVLPAFIQQKKDWNPTKLLTAVVPVWVTGIYPAKEGLKPIWHNSTTNSIGRLPAFIQQKKDWNT